jgi:hypothetical protein
VNQDIMATAQQRAELRTGDFPLTLKALVRRRYIDDREVKPLHPPTTHLIPKVFHPKVGQFPLLNQSDSRRRSPIPDGIEISL